MRHKDNWGSQARIGLFIVGNEAVPESEWWAMVPPNVSLHAARVTGRAPWARLDGERNTVEFEEDLIRGSRQLAAMRLSVVVIAHSSSSILGGDGWDEAVVASLSTKFGSFGSNAIVTTNGLDSIAALRSAGIRRPFLIAPPWFNDATLAACIPYYGERGFEPAGVLRYDAGGKWQDVPPTERYQKGIGFEQEIEPLYDQISMKCPDHADGVLITGTGFRCVAILAALEQALQRPVLSANQVSLWHCLRLAGVATQISGYGSLLRL